MTTRMDGFVEAQVRAETGHAFAFLDRERASGNLGATARAALTYRELYGRPLFSKLAWCLLCGATYHPAADQADSSGQ